MVAIAEVKQIECWHVPCDLVIFTYLEYLNPLSDHILERLRAKDVWSVSYFLKFDSQAIPNM